ncbi:hypothetical protein HRbin28_01233 [bacterium HR28]|nr:hypothetical protein HRbin28_01233 [bacterium HR28]
MRRRIIVALLAVALAAVGPNVVATKTPSPHAGTPFGQHIASMAPDHPRTHGRLFGECVSTMATTGTCPHHE